MLVSVVHGLFDENVVLGMVARGRLFGFGFEAEPNDFMNYIGNVWAAPAYAWRQMRRCTVRKLDTGYTQAQPCVYGVAQPYQNCHPAHCCILSSMKAIWNNTVIAEAPQEQLLRIEGNWYFPPHAIKKQYFVESDTHTTCHWKGEASYYSIVVDGQTNDDAAWYYPMPKAGSIERVGDFTNYVAFWRGVVVVQ